MQCPVFGRSAVRGLGPELAEPRALVERQILARGDALVQGDPDPRTRLGLTGKLAFETTTPPVRSDDCSFAGPTAPHDTVLMIVKDLREALDELRRNPARPVETEVDGLHIELRGKPRRSAADVFAEIGPWEGEAREELEHRLAAARSAGGSAEPPEL